MTILEVSKLVGYLCHRQYTVLDTDRDPYIRQLFSLIGTNTSTTRSTPLCFICFIYTFYIIHSLLLFTVLIVFKSPFPILNNKILPVPSGVIITLLSNYGPSSHKTRLSYRSRFLTLPYKPQRLLGIHPIQPTSLQLLSLSLSFIYFLPGLPQRWTSCNTPETGSLPELVSSLYPTECK